MIEREKDFFGLIARDACRAIGLVLTGVGILALGAALAIPFFLN